MRILMVSPHYVPAYHYGGALHVAHSLGKSLVSQGHEVRVCTTNLRNPTEDLAVPVDAPVMVDGVQVFYEPTVFSRYWGFSPHLARRLWLETKWADVVLIHFHYQFASLIAGWVCRVRKKPYVIFSHGTLNQYGVKARSRIKKLLYLNLLERRNFRQALFTAYHSQEEVEISYRFGRYNIVANGIDANIFEELPEVNNFRGQFHGLRNAIIFLFLGRLAPGKGLDLLLPAFKRFSDKFGETHLVLAGGNELDYETEVRGMLRDLGLVNRVTLTGLITGQEKLGVLQDSDIFVMPSRSEGVSIATLEAMYMGLPVIVTDRVGISPEVKKNRCGLVVPYDEDSLAGALQQMATALDRREMGQRGRRLVAGQYTTDTTTRHLVAEIEGVLASCCRV
jgi:glycosyltransferase involved in cell wall biosynthesis